MSGIGIGCPISRLALFGSKRSATSGVRPAAHYEPSALRPSTIDHRERLSGPGE